MRKSNYRLKLYRSRSGRPGVSRFALGRDYIIIEFKFADGYRYDYSIPGRRKVEKMKELAEAGDGLTTFINQKVRDNYAKKLW